MDRSQQMKQSNEDDRYALDVLPTGGQCMVVVVVPFSRSFGGPGGLEVNSIVGAVGCVGSTA